MWRGGILKKIILFLAVILVTAGCSSTRIVAGRGKEGVSSQPMERVVYLPAPVERDPLVARAREMGGKMARYKESRYRACVELRSINPYADCVRALGPVEMTCWGYGSGSYSCNPQ